MRPTDLNYRSPKQRTPAFYPIPTTHVGQALNFRPLSKNMKPTFPGERRFMQYDAWERVTGKFLGPGSYNDHENKLSMKAQPCPVVIKEMSLGKEAGRPCYIMCGNNLTYDPDLESVDIKKHLRQIGVDDNESSVSGITAFGGRRSTSKLPRARILTNINTLNNSLYPLVIT